MDATPDRLVFQTAVEGLYERGLKELMTPELREGLRGVGIDLDKKLLPAYPLSVWAASLRLSAAQLYPTLGSEAAMAELGRRTIVGMRETMLGRAMFPMMKLLGPSRVLHRMTRSLQNGANFVESKVLREEGQQAEVWLNHVAEPAFYQGLFDAGLVAAGASQVTVDIAARVGHSCTYRLTWS